MKIGILGSGSWGTALTLLLNENLDYEVTLYSSTKSALLNLTRIHPSLKVNIPSNIKIKEFSEEILKEDLLISAIPFKHVRNTYSQDFFKNVTAPIISVTKGLEIGSLLGASNIIKAYTSSKTVAVLSGPTHAEEVIRGVYTSCVLDFLSWDSKEEIVIKSLFDFAKPKFIVKEITTNFSSTAHDVEICGALKNLFAISSGIIDSCVENTYGENTRALFVSESIKEFRDLATQIGLRNSQILNSSAGIADLLVTMSNKDSRNYKFGLYIAQGLSEKEALNKVGMTVEGLETLKAVKNYIDDSYPLLKPLLNFERVNVEELFLEIL